LESFTGPPERKHSAHEQIYSLLLITREENHEIIASPCKLSRSDFSTISCSLEIITVSSAIFLHPMTAHLTDEALMEELARRNLQPNSSASSSPRSSSPPSGDDMEDEDSPHQRSSGKRDDVLQNSSSLTLPFVCSV
jgi:hypothetical protein